MRLSLFINRLITKHKDEYPKLYQFLLDKKEEGRIHKILMKTPEGKKKLSKMKPEEFPLPWRNRTILLEDDDDVQKEYLEMVDKYCRITSFPSPYKEVWVETSDGGKLAAFCNINHEWFYRNISNKNIPVKNVMRWWYDGRSRRCYYVEMIDEKKWNGGMSW